MEYNFRIYDTHLAQDVCVAGEYTSSCNWSRYKFLAAVLILAQHILDMLSLQGREFDNAGFAS